MSGPRLRGRACLFAAFFIFSAAFARKATALLPDPRYGQSVALLPNGKILVVGGTDGVGPTATAEILDTTRGSEFVSPQAVSAANPMAFARSSATITVLPNGNVLVTGGWDGTNIRCDAEVYNPTANTWVSVPAGGSAACAGGTMSSARFNHTATPLLTGGVLVCGGQTNGGADVASASCDIFTPTGSGSCVTAGGCFAPTGSMLLARYLHSATLLNDGTVWVAGGWNNGGANSNPPYVVTTERYSPATGVWTQAQPLNAARANHTATLTGDNKVLVAGGINGNGTSDTLLAVDNTLNPPVRTLTIPRFGLLNSSELFDPTGGAPVQGPPIAARVQAHAATLLPSGVVSIFGGRGNIPPTNVTSFPTPPMFTSGGLTGSFTGAYSQHVITGGNGSIPVSFYLGVPVTGSIINGDVEFINPKLTIAGVTVALTSNYNVPGAGLRANLAGTRVSCDSSGVCGYVNANFALSNFQGSYSLTTPVVTSNNLPSQAVTGTLNFAGGTAASPTVNSGVAQVVSGNFSTHLQITVPSFLAGLSVSSVTLTLDPTATAGWTETSSYTVVLNGGTGEAVGPFTVNTAAGVSYIDIPNFTFTGVVGTLTLIPTDPTYSLNSGFTVPLAPNFSARMATIGFSMQYAASGIDLTGQTLAFDSADVIIRDMIYGDNEYFTPNTSQWAFQPPTNKVTRPGATRVGASSLITPSGTEWDIGGLECSGGCASLVPAADGVGGSRQDSGTIWTPMGTNQSGSDAMVHAFHTATSLPDGTILLAGGTDGTVVLSTAEIFNPGALTFAPTATAMNVPRQQHSASLLPNGRVLLAGGFTTAPGSGPTNSAEIYYPDTKVFLPAPSMISARSQHVAITLPNGNVFVAGGFNGLNGFNTVTSSAEIYSSTAPSWTAVPDMTTAAGGTGVLEKRAIAAGVQLQDGRIMLCGGTNESGILSSAVAYNPATNSWAALHVMPAALQGHTATLLFDGRVLVAGGNNGTGETTSSYIYDPVGDSWTTASALNTARFGHTATLLPNGTVLIAGGVQGSGATANAVQTMEYFVPDVSSWIDPGGANLMASGARADHTATLGPDGRIYFVGGINGSIGTGGAATFYRGVDSIYFTLTPDQYSNTQPSVRQSTITATTATSPLAVPVLPGSSFNVAGQRFRGATEAAGGTGSADSSFSTPRLLLSKIDGSNGGGSSSSPGFAADLTSQIYSTPANAATLNSNLTVTLPNNNALPYGWYMAWEGTGDLYSKGLFVQVGPPKPAAAPASLTGLTLGVSSISWTWNAVAGVDGYNVYQASTSVLIGTVAANGPLRFYETGLTPNARVAVLVAGYTISGDGPSSLSPFTSVAPITTINTIGCGANNTGDTTTSILWNWNAVGSASSYNVYNATTGALITATLVPSFHDVNLAINSSRVIDVGAVTNGILGPLSPQATCYTQAAVPAPPSGATPLMTSTETTSVSVNWTNNGNPSGTIYQAAFTSYVSTSSLLVTTVTVTQQPVSALQAYLSGLMPSQYYSAQIFAQNGAGTLSAPLTAGTTFTHPAAPQSLSVLGTTPVSITGSWNTNSNSTMTYYQLIYSTDNFVTNVATAIPFSSRFNGSSFLITGLLTSVQYSLQVQAENPYGQISASVSTMTTTFNGGAAAGSLAGVLSAAVNSEFSGNLGGPSGRVIDMRSPSGTFPGDTTVTVSTYGLADHGGALCPGGVPGLGSTDGVALSIVDNPAMQPSHPIFLSVSYTPAEAATFQAPASQLALERFDPGSGTCVPMPTTFNTAARTFLAQLNHFSLYQLVAVPLATSADTARIYPNPYHANTDGFVTIDQVPPASRVRIFTLTGERILDGTSDGTGRLTWAADNTAGRPVSSGLYLITVESGGSKKILKLAVIR